MDKSSGLNSKLFIQRGDSDDTNKNMSFSVVKKVALFLQHCHVVYVITGTYGILSILVSPYRDQYMHTR